MADDTATSDNPAIQSVFNAFKVTKSQAAPAPGGESPSQKQAKLDAMKRRMTPQGDNS